MKTPEDMITELLGRYPDINTGVPPHVGVLTGQRGGDGGGYVQKQDAPGPTVIVIPCHCGEEGETAKERLTWGEGDEGTGAVTVKAGAKEGKADGMGGGTNGGRDIRHPDAPGPSIYNTAINGGSDGGKEAVGETRERGRDGAGIRDDEDGFGANTDDKFWRPPQERRDRCLEQGGSSWRGQGGDRQGERCSGGPP